MGGTQFHRNHHYELHVVKAPTDFGRSASSDTRSEAAGDEQAGCTDSFHSLVARFASYDVNTTTCEICTARKHCVTSCSCMRLLAWPLSVSLAHAGVDGTPCRLR